MKKMLSSLAAYFFAFLFVYAAVSKLSDFENFQVQLAQSPLLSAYAGFVSYAVIVTELAVAGLLLLPRSRPAGLYASFGLMVAFTVYIYLILNYSDFVPCSCGGILEQMGWTEHLIFNIACVALAFAAVALMQKRRKRSLIISGLVAVVAGGLVTGLFLSSEYIIRKGNNFTRRFPHHPIIEEGSYDLKVNSYYFAGSDYQNVYLANPSSPFRLLRIDYSLQKPDTLDIVPDVNHRFRNLQYRIEAGRLFAYDGSVPVIYTASLDSTTITLRQISFRQVYFDQLVAFTPERFMLRVEDKKSGRTALARLQIGLNSAVRIHNSVLSNRADGGFDADGRLLYDGYQQTAYYVFYYRNQMLRLDHDGQVASKLRTIDTVTTANIQIATLSDGRKKMMRPPLMVNRNMTVHRGIIFNQSGLMGRYESWGLWRKNAVVDVYTTAPAGYWGSMYVQHRGKNRMSQMCATDNYFFTLSGNEIVRYRFAQTVTENFIHGERRKPVKE